MDGSIEKRLAVLEAREQIKELRYTYAWYASRGQREKIAGLFMPDGIFNLRSGDQRICLRGREEILAYLEKSMWPHMIFPILHNHVIDVDGDEAVGTCVMEARTREKIAEFFPDGFLGYYHDRAVRQSDGRWLFAERRWFTYWPDFEDSGLPVRPGC